LEKVCDQNKNYFDRKPCETFPLHWVQVCLVLLMWSHLKMQC